METIERTKLRKRLSERDEVAAARQRLDDRYNEAVRQASDARAELATLEAEAEAEALAGGAPSDIEARVAACRRRVAAAERMARDLHTNTARDELLQAANEAARWAARAVMAAEAERLLAEYGRKMRAALTLQRRLEKYCRYAMATRGGGENQSQPAFAAPERIGGGVVLAEKIDQHEGWNLAEFEREWAAFEQALLVDPDAPAPGEQRPADVTH